MTDSPRTPEEQDEASQDPALPPFITHPGKVDRWLLTALGLVTVYSLALIPFRAYLLLNHTVLYTALSGSGLSVLITASRNPGETALLATVTALAALSHLKFMPLYFLMGKHWGQAFLDWMFASHTPLWYRKLEGFVQRNLFLCLFLAFIPFSPIPVTILVTIAGIRKMKGAGIAIYMFILALALKGFYLYLGVTYGEAIQPTLQSIDRVMMQITLVLIAYMFATIWWKNRKK